MIPVPRWSPTRSAVTAAVAAGLLLGACSSSQDGATTSPTQGTTPPGAPVGSAPPGTGPAASGDPQALAAQLATANVRLEQIADVDEPTVLVPRSGTPNLYVAEKAGRVKVLTVTQTRDNQGNVTKTDVRVGGTVLDISRNVANQGERGLLGMTFSSDGRRLYIHYSDLQGHTNVDEYRVDGDRADTSSKRRILFQEQPFPNHNGGELSFGPDGFLYLGLGDGGSSGDPLGNGQKTDTVLGKILRIDPEGSAEGKAYGIPDGNPFAAGGGAPEIWAWGLRNPWRFSFDSATGDLWIADVGQNEIEEINWAPAGNGGAGRAANFGWNLMEGSSGFEGGRPPEGYVGPVYDYTHDGGNCSVTGGFVYRGKAIPALAGVYLFADYCKGELRGILRGEGNAIADKAFGVSAPQVTSFGQDADGELYVLSQEGGIFKIAGA